MKAITVCTLTLTFSGCHWKAWSHHLQLHNKPIITLFLASLPQIQNFTKVARSKRGVSWRVNLHNVPEQIFSNRTKRLKSQSTSCHSKEIPQLTKNFTENVYITYILSLNTGTTLLNQCLQEPTKLICRLLLSFFFSFWLPIMFQALGLGPFTCIIPLSFSNKPIQLVFLLYRKGDRSLSFSPKSHSC